MAAATPRPKLIAIVGPTASGKSQLALKIAQKYSGEIICADSRTIYKDMDIGTAKPTAKELKQIPHWGLDLVTPDKTYNVAQFKKYAQDKISDIQKRGRLPIIVGGSGLYVDSVLFDYQFSQPGAHRDELNPRHLKKADKPLNMKLRADTLIIGLQVPREELKKRVVKRVEKMVKAGLIDEVEQIAKQYGWDSKALLAPGYKAVRQYLDGSINLEATKTLFVKNDMDLAKRQLTWFKRNPNIQWFSSTEAAYKFVVHSLNN